jgi:hypothetical protein
MESEYRIDGSISYLEIFSFKAMQFGIAQLACSRKKHSSALRH